MREICALNSASRSESHVPQMKICGLRRGSHIPQICGLNSDPRSKSHIPQICGLRLRSHVSGLNSDPRSKVTYRKWARMLLLKRICGRRVQPQIVFSHLRVELRPQIKSHIAQTPKNGPTLRQPLRSSYSAHMHGRSAIRFAPLRPCMMRAPTRQNFQGGFTHDHGQEHITRYSRVARRY
jgi:hypothetical protein